MLPILTNNTQRMSLKEITDMIGVRHDKAMIKVAAMAEDSSFGTVSKMDIVYNDKGQTIETYMLDQRQSIAAASRLNVALCMRVIDRWQELEVQVKTPSLPDFSNPVEAARAWADAKEQELKAKADLALAAPKVEFVDKYVDSTGLMGFRQVCKLLKAKENDFRAFLEDNKIMYRLGGAMTPYAQHIDAGRFEVKTGTAANDHTFNSAKFTPKGVEWISKVWRKRNEA